ncbi:RTF1 [[Candida] subhashii]|uniref:RTF1 n=1 Tax=[Candida] subhashii TaxID=561895 RepID=A0A8J5UMZ0_9ASCO|nr:RTF1 [[Candida] subhashii]KAG7663347.1 RTF1 [[Candida] subhashii]
MSDLEDDLLALAGGDDNDYESEEDVTSSKRKTKSYNEEEESDEDQVLSKRRRVDTSDFEIEDYGDDQADEKAEAEEELINPYPLDGKYKDEQDRDELESMDEMQREQILFDRSQEMERYNEKKYLAQRMKQQRKLAEPATKASRASNRTKTTTKPDKMDKFSELRKQREQRSRRKTTDDYEEESDEEEEEDNDLALSEDEEEEYDDYDAETVTWGGVSKSKPKRNIEPAKLADINRVKMGRTVLTQYCFYSDFNVVVLDTYGKINLGMDKRTRRPIYRMVKIIDVKSIPEKAYRLNNSKCDLFLTVSQNRNQTKDFPISIFSDSPLEQEDFDRYLAELKKTGESIDYLEDVNEKFQQLQVFFNRGLSDKDVNEMIARKKKLQESKGVSSNDISGYDAVTQKAKLMDELKIAKQENNLNRIRDLISKLKRIDQILIGQPNAKASSESSSGMSKVNERNRKLNAANIRKAEVKSRNTLQVNDGGDPFSRLKTVTRMFYQDLINQENEKALKDINYEKLLQEKSKQEEKIAKSTYRDLGEMDKLINSIDIDIDISW